MTIHTLTLPAPVPALVPKPSTRSNRSLITEKPAHERTGSAHESQLLRAHGLVRV
jgi:hypothetical protein